MENAEKNENPENLSGMDTNAAREYILHYITTLKLTEKQAAENDLELAKWQNRIDLALSKSAFDLAGEAKQEVQKYQDIQEKLNAGIAELKSQIETMRRQLPGIAARERTIDPDVLEQELLMARGYLPGEEQKAASDRAFQEIEKNTSAGAALSELKAKIGKL
jgi:phage shock protein A